MQNPRELESLRLYALQATKKLSGWQLVNHFLCGLMQIDLSCHVAEPG
jgi:hypothetical protein